MFLFIGTLFRSIVFLLNLFFWAFWVFVFALFKITIPIQSCKIFFAKCILSAVNYWIVGNIINLKTCNTKIEIIGDTQMDLKSWYMVISNHQSWVDIAVLQIVFLKKIPFLKFFLKKELIWVPIMGLCWWALDFPFMKRYSSSFLKKNPHLKGKDLETTKKACEKFKHIPISVTNFLEGTRFRKEKHKKQNSPYKNLLKPKAGGLAFVLESMDGIIHTLIDVTIYYPQKNISFADLVMGKIKKIIVHIKIREIPMEIFGNYVEDEKTRKAAQNYVNQLWHEKDLLIEKLKLTSFS